MRDAPTVGGDRNSDRSPFLIFSRLCLLPVGLPARVDGGGGERMINSRRTMDGPSGGEPLRRGRLRHVDSGVFPKI